MSLKAVLITILVALGVLVLAAAGSLGVLTSYLHRVTSSLGSTVEGVRLAEELEVALLNHYRHGDAQRRPVLASQENPLTRLEGQLHVRLNDMEPLASTPEEQALMRDIRQKVSDYLFAYHKAYDDPARMDEEVEPLLERALADLDKLIGFNVREARDALAQANRWDGWADVGGTTLAMLLLLGMAGVLFWMPRAVLRPVMQVSQAMRRFGAGGKSVRAPEAGPLELREMARTFNEMAASLTRQQEDQLTFLAGVAHDLRNPLSALKMSTALVDQGRQEASPERIQKMLALVSRQVARLDRMVGDLLDATRIEAGKLELHLEERDVRELARAVVELYQSAGASHELRLFLPENPAPLRCDGTRIEQVLNNLVSNALKYSPARTTVDVTVQQEGDEVLFTVEDQGIGIAAEEQRHIFAPFRRTPGAREHAAGAGLGLSVARRIVEAHGGRIEVQSRPGQGSLFRVRVPSVRAEQAVTHDAEPSSEPSLEPRSDDALH